MNTLAIDIETYSSVDLLKSGVYKYVEAPDFEILICAYSINGAAPVMIDVKANPKNPMWVDIFKHSLTDKTILKTAYNANFERTCLSKYFGLELPVEQWECTMAKSSMLGLPLSLDAVSKTLKIAEQKDSAGKALIRYFSVPCKPTKANGQRTRNLPEHAPDKWDEFKNYCLQDVRTEVAIRRKIEFFEVPAFEKKLWHLDQKINDRGVLLDPDLIKAAISISEENTKHLFSKASDLTGLDNPNSASQLKGWLSKEMGSEVNSLTKEAIPVLLEAAEDHEDVTDVLEIRQEMSKTSVKKYHAMLKGICSDNRLRGLLQYYGANRTGRWAGRLVQVQNLPRNEMDELDLARRLVKHRDMELLDMLYDSIPDVLSQLIRTAFIAPKGKTLLPVDFAAIEARVIAWLAGEKWRLDVFNTHGKIYEASASQMFKVPIEQITKGNPLRQKGKVSELALGYQGGPNALISMGALKMGLTEDELPQLVAMWRNANRAIVKLWNHVEEAALTAMSDGKVTIQFGISFEYDSSKKIFFIKLPSGRKLSYLRPVIKPSRFGGEMLVYEGLNQTTKQWSRIETYGGKLVENIVQAIARDCLADAMLRLDAAGFDIVMHIHDEAVLEVDELNPRLELVNTIMSQPIGWAKGLPLKADGYLTPYYKKD